MGDTSCEDRKSAIKGNTAVAAQPAKCEYKEQVDGSAITYKCKSQKGNTDAKAKLCGETAVAKAGDAGKCSADANGGLLCCQVTSVQDKPGSPKMCVEKKQDTSSAGTAVLSAFAVSAA